MARVLFVCLHNAGRSQMSRALFERAAEGRHEADSAGTTPADRMHPEVVEAMRELGVDLNGARPKKLTDDLAREADVVVTMGCGDECPYIPGKRYLDWDLPDPKGRPLEEVREIRDDIGRRVLALVEELDGVSGLAIEVSDLHKSYAGVEAVRGVSFGVRQGEVYGLLGPNGAGKTTTVEILEGYRRRNSGQVWVLGHDPEVRDRRLQERVGIVLQSCGFYPRVTVREAVTHFAKAYPRPRDPTETIALVGLDEKADARTNELSGGQRRRLDLALALVGDPELVFLDEPTTGFDPAARRTAWNVVRRLRDLGKTVVLTTHYLEEAQELADRVAIVKDGRIVAEGPPAELGPGNYRVSYLSEGRRVTHETDDPTELLHRLTRDAVARGERLEGLEVNRPTLEEVYLELTAEADR